MIRVLTLLMLLPVLTSLHPVLSQLVPDNRRIEWDPGIPGGIPSAGYPVVNVLDYGADPTGKADSYHAITAAMNRLPEGGGVIYLPEGVYRLDSMLMIRKDKIVLRGYGPGSTKLYSYARDHCIEISRDQAGEWQRMISGSELHSDRMTVEDGSLFTVGEFAEAQQENDPVVMYTRPEWKQEWSEDAVGQLLEIASVDGNELTFASTLHYPYDQEQDPVIRPVQLVEYVGFEDLYIEKMVPEGHTFLFRNAAYGWLKNVESYHTRKSHVEVISSLGLEIRECFMHRSFHYGGGGSGYGVDCHKHATDCLIEDNVFDSLRHAMLVQVGANGNVFGYNYSLNPVQGDGEVNLNQGWIPPDISVHGHYPFMNLFEGNDVNEIGISDYWGPAGIGNTYFRNEVNDEGIIYYDHSDCQNVIGNITTVIDYTDSSSKYRLEHGNVVAGSVVWNDTIDDRLLPDSYYMHSKPSFLGGCAWPAFGPDAVPGEILPAQERYESGQKDGASHK
jgi:hypothetical protein